jgi:hypothetical protein
MDLNRTLLPVIYCDGSFGVMPTIGPRFTGRNLGDNQQRWNVRMAKVRIALENLLGFYRNICRVFATPARLRLLNSGENFRKLIVGSFLVPEY